MAILCAAVLAPLVLAACGSSSGGSSSATSSSGEGKQKTIAFSHAASEAPIAVAVTAAAKEQAQKLGYRFLSDDPRGDTATQIKDIENWITQGVDAIVVFPFDPSTMVALQKRAQDKGIKWITYSAKMPGADGAVLFSHEDSGKIIAGAVSDWIAKQNGKPVEALLLTASALTSVAPRWELPKAAIEKFPNAKVVASQDALDEATGLKVTESVLQAHPKLRVVVSMNDDSALGAMKAFENAGIPADEAFIAGQDGNIRALEELQKKGGYYKATAALHVKTLGHDITNIADRSIKGESNVEIEQKPVLATPDDPQGNDKLLGEWK
ncbi:MAG: sugar transporter periplasmic protein [Solirubrobacterales bacterium]|jgi:ABC-type sugar transport system substrate-binding protein|nr:sugar transporter periplasmic protein [Solirubrobacterales bacterium]